jgi:hypothetical protein
VLTLQARAGQHVRQQILLTRLEGDIDRERVIAWRAMSEQVLSPVSTIELTEARRRTDAVLARSIAAGGDPAVFDIQDRLRTYRAAVNDALRLLAAGQVEQAYRVDQTQATPFFAPLRDATTEAALAADQRHGHLVRLAGGGGRFVAGGERRFGRGVP